MPHEDALPDGTDHPSRRSVLLLLGAGSVAPAALGLMIVNAGQVGGELDGLRFEVLGTSRHLLAGHTAHPAGPVTPMQTMSWPDVVRVQMRVQNVATLPLLVSPGQFRLRTTAGLSVMPTAWQHGPAPLADGAARTGWIDYRAPAGDALLGLEFSPAGRREPVGVALAVSAVPA